MAIASVSIVPVCDHDFVIRNDSDLMYLTTHFDRYIETYPDHGDADALRAAQGRFRPVFDVSRDCCGRKGAWSALDSFVGFDFAESKYKKAPEDLVDDIAAIVAQVSESLRRFRRRPDSGTQAAGVKLRVRKYARSVPRRPKGLRALRNEGFGHRYDTHFFPCFLDRPRNSHQKRSENTEKHERLRLTRGIERRIRTGVKFLPESRDHFETR